MEVKEKELVELKGIKPEFEKTKTKVVSLENELNEFREKIAEIMKEKDAVKAELETEREEKNEVCILQRPIILCDTKSRVACDMKIVFKLGICLTILRTELIGFL